MKSKASFIVGLCAVAVCCGCVAVAVLQWLGRRSGFFSGISGVVAFSGRRSCVVTDSNFNAGANHRGECVYNAGDSSHPSSHEA